MKKNTDLMMNYEQVGLQKGHVMFGAYGEFTFLLQLLMVVFKGFWTLQGVQQLPSKYVSS